MNLFRILFAQFDSTAIRDLRGWRERVLNGILRGVFIIWIFALVSGINNVIEAYNQEKEIHDNPLAIAAFAVVIYLSTTVILSIITFNRNLKLEIRAGLLLFIFYALGTTGLALSSFSGDGRILFFAFIILAAVFLDLRYSLSAFIFIFITFVVIGWLQVSEILIVPAERQINSTDVRAWISGGMVFLMLGIAALISIAYLLQALSKGLSDSRASLLREQNLSRMIRTLSDVNQLIVREQDAAQILRQACEILVDERGYIFSWISLLEADGITLNLAASAGETIDPALFTASLDGKGSGPSCVVAALRSKQPFLIEPAENDPCLSCPLLKKYPQRSSLVLPIVREAHVFGVLTVVHPSPSGVFDEEEINLLVELANDLAYALEKLESEQRVLTYARHQAFLNEITQTALETPNLETMLQRFVEGFEKVLNADGYYFALWDEARQMPGQFISSDMFKDALSLSPTLKPGDRIFSQSILDSGRVLAVEDIMNTPHISPHFAAVFPIRSALGLPLIADNHKLGALVLGFRETYHFTADEIEFAGQAARQIALAMLKARLDAETRAKASELGSLYAAAQDMASSIMDPPALLDKLARHMTEALKVTSGNIMAADLAKETMQVVGEYWSDDALSIERHLDIGKTYFNSDFSTIMRSMIAGKALIIHADSGNLTDAERAQFKEYGIQTMMFVPIMAHGKLFGNIELWESRRRREFALSEIHLAQAMAGHAASIIENSRLFEALAQSEAYFRALIENSAEGVAIMDAEGNVRYIASSEERLTGYAPEEVQGQSAFRYMHPDDLPNVLETFAEGAAISGAVRSVEYRLQRKDGEWRHFEITGHNMLDDPYINGIVANYRDITERKRAEDNLRRHALELETLAAASAALRVAQSVTEMIPILTKQAMRAVGGNYGSIFLLDSESGDYVSHGWFSARGESKNILKDESILRHRPGEGITGHVAMTGEIYVTEDVQKDPVMFMLDGEKKRLQNLHGGISLPLRAQEEIIGVMHIWMFERHIFSETEIRILIAFAEMAGNAIHRAMLFEQTLQHADELTQAYDNTLAGWARALELRDEITEGHTRRVTELTLKLARALSIPENELVQIRRGALLHDIGKMGIPDSILHKPGAFTIQERIIMERHTQYAYDMISSISFLDTALDIPFCHHEHWDGNGYPRKLKGEQIPLSARIFSIVDVWDALTSDRPYRLAWSKEKTREYILERAGKQFDPRVVEAFFSLEIE